MSIEVRQHAPGIELNDFLRVPSIVYRDDPNYVPPLRMEITERLTPGKNPFWDHGEGALFTAHRDGALVGRISAQVDHEHLRIHDDGAGFFGFFDTIDDQAVADALLDRAERWIASRALRTMRGPLSLTINEEVGVLVEGFDDPPVIAMAHHRPYQHKLAEAAGLRKEKDLLAWRYRVQEPSARVVRAWEAMNALPEVRFRTVDKSRMREELDRILEIFNDAWRDNWGFVPATEAEVDKMAQDMRLVIDEKLAFFAEVKGEPVGMVICLPNLNEAAHDLDGRLFPTGWAKLLWRLKVRGTKSARLMLLGLKRKMRGIKRYGALSTAMYAELAHRGIREGYEWAELGWTLEDNRPINLGIQAMRGEVYKRYRIYERTVGESS